MNAQRWLQRLTEHAAQFASRDTPVVLAGDYNVIPTEKDVYKPERWVGRLLSQGWTDAIRHLHPDATINTYWDFFRNAYERDAGLRIDHLLLSASAAKQPQSAAVDREVRGWQKASYHAPAWVELSFVQSPRVG